LHVIAWSDDACGRELGERARAVHPHGVAATVAAIVGEQIDGAGRVTVAGLHEPHDGLPESLIAEADVLVWWGHDAHDRVADDTVERVCRRVLGGLGLIALHSAHHAKVFRRLMGTSCDLRWRDSGQDEESISAVDRSHPIAAGVENRFCIGPHEMYGEPFDIPAPDRVVFLSTFTGGEIFRSGCCFTRGSGRIFYFSPGHETYPVYEHPQVRRVIGNALGWARARP
jgi:trehalose utilization protein